MVRIRALNLLRWTYLLWTLSSVSAYGDDLLKEKGKTVAIIRSSDIQLPNSKNDSPRMVDGIAVPPFRYFVDAKGGNEPTPSKSYFQSHLEQWPANENVSLSPLNDLPLAYVRRARGPYINESGKIWIEKINQWYGEGVAAGLSQDTFRSYDNGHSSIQQGRFPLMNSEPAVSEFGALGTTIFRPRITMGVQSYGNKGNAVIEQRTRRMLTAFYDPNGRKIPLQRYYRQFYENNFLFVAPAVGSFAQKEGDQFTFLSPFYLHSIGASGTDSRLLIPLIMASAALPPDLKTRMLRSGLFVPTLMYLFKSTIRDDIRSSSSHVPAYTLPSEADTDYEGPSPFLDRILNSAHDLTHIPPVSRLRITELVIETENGDTDERLSYYENNTYAFSGALRRGQAFVITVDLRFSWTDESRDIASYTTSVLRGEASIESLNQEDSVMRIRIPWAPTNNKSDLRTDIVFLVHDGSYYSAPAYVSVRHIHLLDPITLGIKAR